MATQKDEGRARLLLASSLADSLRKKHGEAVLILASDQKVQVVPRIPTGIFPLDYALGGGVPAGRISTFWGNKSSAKTTVVLKTIAQAQKMCGSCWSFPDTCKCKTFRETVAAFIDAEGTFDHTWAGCLGIDVSRLLLSRPEYGEQALDIGEALLRSGECDILAIDSLAFLAAAKEVEESVDKETMGLQARMIGKGIRKFVSALNSLDRDGKAPTVLLINQVRMKLGVMFGNPETQPGGMSAGFAATTETKLWSGKYEMDKDFGRPLQVEMNFRVEKNKSAPPRMEGSFTLLLADTEVKKKGDVYDEGALVDLAEKWGLVEKKGGTWACLGEEFAAKSKVEQKVMTDPEFRGKVRQAVMMSLQV